MNVRLCYASQRNEKNEDLLQDLRDILTEARDFNDLNGICGVLYYADNAFFQCLEGEQEVVERLFEKIQKDQRHYNIKWLCTYSIDEHSANSNMRCDSFKSHMIINKLSKFL